MLAADVLELSLTLGDDACVPTLTPEDTLLERLSLTHEVLAVEVVVTDAGVEDVVLVVVHNLTNFLMEVPTVGAFHNVG